MDEHQRACEIWNRLRPLPKREDWQGPHLHTAKGGEQAYCGGLGKCELCDDPVSFFNDEKKLRDYITREMRSLGLVQ